MIPTKLNRRQSCITVSLFCILIFGFAAASVITPSNEFSENENRVLAQRPVIQAETLRNGTFEADYEEYLTDQFVLRDFWIGWKTFAERLTGKRESKDIYFAQDDYLIEKHTGSFTADMAQDNIMTLAQFVQRYQEQFGTSRILREHKGEEVYYRTDHHWKTIAAFYVYREWAREQGYDVPEISDYQIRTVTDCFEGTIQSKLGINTAGDTIELFIPEKQIFYTVQKDNADEEENGFYDYSALDTKDKYAVYFGGNHPFMKIRTESEEERKILVIKDSYANCFIPFMVGEFREIDVLDIRYTNQKLSELIAGGGYTDLLVLYNASGFAEDMSITKLLN